MILLSPPHLNLHASADPSVCLTENRQSGTHHSTLRLQGVTKRVVSDSSLSRPILGSGLLLKHDYGALLYVCVSQVHAYMSV